MKITILLLILTLTGCNSDDSFDQTSLDLIQSQKSITSVRSLNLNGAGTVSQNALSFFNSSPLMQFSIGFWLKMDDEKHLVKGDIFKLSDSNSYTLNISFKESFDGALYFNIDTPSGTLEAKTNVTNINQWNYYFFTYETTPSTSISVLKIYLNGVSRAFISGQTDEFSVSGASSFSFSPFGAELSNGKIDEVTIWETTLEPTEAKALYNARGYLENTLSSKAPLAWFRMGENNEFSGVLKEEINSVNLQTFTSTIFTENSFVQEIGSSKNSTGGSGGSDVFDGDDSGFGGEIGDGPMKPDFP